MNIKIDSKNTFHSVFKYFSDKIEPSYCGLKMNISDRYGAGQMHSLQLSDKISVMITDVCFHEGLTIRYQVPADHFEVAYCLEGGMNPIGGNNHALFSQGQLCLSAPNREERTVSGEMAYLPGQRYQGISFAFSEALPGFPESDFQELLYENAAPRLLSSTAPFFTTEASGSMQTAFLQMLHKPISGKADLLYSEGKMLEIISLVASDLSKSAVTISLDDYEAAQIKKVRTILSANLQNPPTVLELSAMLGINRNKLQSGFRQIYGDTIFGYYRKLRLEYAKMLLEDHRSSVENIAFLVGYSSVSQFRAAFKNHFGVLPSQCKFLS